MIDLSLRIERNRIIGSANKDYRACFAADMGSTLGQMIGSGNVVVTGRDGKGFSRLMKRSLTCGIMENGIQVLDTRLVPIPVVRYCIRDSRSDFGVYMGFSWRNPSDLVTSLFDDRGAIASHEMLEELIRMIGKGSRLVSAQEVGDIMFFPQSFEGYRSHLLEAVDVDSIIQASPKVLMDCSNGAVSVILPRILRGLNCEVVSFHDNAPAYLTDKPVLSGDPLMSAFADHLVERDGDIGLALDPCGESMRVIDDKGNILTQEDLGRILATRTGAKRIAVHEELMDSRSLSESTELVPLEDEYQRLMPEDIDAALDKDHACYLASGQRRWWDALPVALRLVELVSKGEKLSLLA